MKPEIQARMNKGIADCTAYNTLFNLLVETSETALEVTATMLDSNQWEVNGEAISVGIVCNDNEYNTCVITIKETSTGQAVGYLNINIHGQINEEYHSLPRSIRQAVYGYVDEIYDAVEGWINPETT